MVTKKTQSSNKKNIPASVEVTEGSLILHENLSNAIINTTVKSVDKKKSKEPKKEKKHNHGIKLLQIGIKTDHHDKVFEHYDFNSIQINYSYVLDAILAAQNDDSLQSCHLWGMLTNDFNQRTGLDGQALLSLIEANQGYDLYYCSAHPELESLYHNPWRTPEVTHPGFVALSRSFLKAAGLSDTPIDSISHSSLFATGHLMVATPEIWDKYVNFVKMVFERVKKNLSSEELVMLFDEKQIKGRMTYISLITARLLSVFMMLKSSDFKAFKIQLPDQEEKMNSHLKFLREMKDFGLVQKSKWHLAAWLNYRGLYLSHVMGKSWINKHFKNITPAELHAGMPVASISNYYSKSIIISNKS